MDKNIIIKIVLHLPPQLIFELYCKHKFINQSRLIRIAVARYLSTSSFFKLLDYIHVNPKAHLQARDCETNDLKVYLRDFQLEVLANSIILCFNYEKEPDLCFKIIYNMSYEILVLFGLYIDIFDETHVIEKYIITGMRIIKNKIKFKVREVK